MLSQILLRKCAPIYEFLCQRIIAVLLLCEKSSTGYSNGISPKKVIPVHNFRQDTAVFCQGPGGIPGKVGAVGIAQGTEHESHIHSTGGGVFGAEGGIRGPFGEALVIGIGHISIGPGGDIRKRMGFGLQLCLYPLTQGTYQHGHCLHAAGGPVQVKISRAIFQHPYAKEEI